MKNKAASICAAALLAALLGSCVSANYREMTIQERLQENVVGSVTAEFTSFRPFNRRDTKGLRRRAHDELMRAAREQHQGVIEVRNIRIEGRGHGGQFLYMAAPPVAAVVIGAISDAARGITNTNEGVEITGLFVAPGLFLTTTVAGNIQRITATGDVVLHGAAGAGHPLAADPRLQRIGGAVASAAGSLIAAMPPGEAVAVLSVRSDDHAAAAYAIAQLEFRLIGSGRFRVVDRRILDQVRMEQDFHVSGDVDDASAVSIGQMLGAAIVITGDLADAGGGFGWLGLRALDVRTGQIVSMALERF